MFKMLTNNFYRGIGFLVMGSFYQTQFYLFLSFLLKSPCVSFPSTQYYSVSLNHSLHSCYFAPSLRRARIKSLKVPLSKSTVPYKCLKVKSLLLGRAYSQFLPCSLRVASMTQGKEYRLQLGCLTKELLMTGSTRFLVGLVFNEGCNREAMRKKEIFSQGRMQKNEPSLLAPPSFVPPPLAKPGPGCN